MFSVVVIVAGATALHNVYTGAGPALLGVAHYSQIESIPVAGQVLGPAFPGALGFLAPRFFSLGLIARRVHHVDLGVVDDDVFLPRHRAPELAASPTTTRSFKTVFATWIAVPALVTPFWQLPALLKAILAMVGNLLMAPLAVGIILYFVNRPRSASSAPMPAATSCSASRCCSRSGSSVNGTAMTATMTRADVVQRIENAGVVAVVRLTDSRAGLDVANALIAGGVTVIEVTMTVPRAAELIAELSRRCRARSIGAGTVTDPGRGASGDRCRREVCRQPRVPAAHRRSLSRARRAVLPGMFLADRDPRRLGYRRRHREGVSGDVARSGFIKDLRGPFPTIKIMPTGGVTRDNAADWIRAGAVAVGAGSALVDPKAVQAGKFDVVTENARAFVDAVRGAR